MISRSVPGYDNVIATTGLLASEHLPAGGKVFDLGCSLGATAYATLAYVTDPTVQIVGVDSSEPMIREAQRQQRDSRLSFVHGDILKQDFSGADVVILNYVLQFIDPEQRLALLTRIREQMSHRRSAAAERKKVWDSLLQPNPIKRKWSKPTGRSNARTVTASWRLARNALRWRMS
ncbi:UNVERIFIED_CONTAM: hypothetical protein GTU68_010235 [Idotea baltica]|nr:hypothetical protein [Idotea baltica]